MTCLKAMPSDSRLGSVREHRTCWRANSDIVNERRKVPSPDKQAVCPQTTAENRARCEIWGPT